MGIKLRSSLFLTYTIISLFLFLPFSFATSFYEPQLTQLLSFQSKEMESTNPKMTLYKKLINSKYWNNRKTFYAASTGISRLKGWIYRGYYFNKNYFGAGISDFGVSYSEKKGGYFLMGLGITYQRNFFPKYTPFLASNISLPYLYTSRENCYTSFDGIETDNGFNIPRISLGTGMEFRLFRFILSFEISEKRKISSIFLEDTNLGYGVSLTIPLLKKKQKE